MILGVWGLVGLRVEWGLSGWIVDERWNSGKQPTWEGLLISEEKLGYLRGP